MNTDTERLAALARAIREIPDISITFNLDGCEEDEIGIIPIGWNLRIPENCAEAVAINAYSFADLLDELIKWERKGTPNP